MAPVLAVELDLQLLVGAVVEQTAIAGLEPIPGNLPDLRRSDLPTCRFQGRCERSIARCSAESPTLLANGSAHRIYCFNPLQSEATVARRAAS